MLKYGYQSVLRAKYELLQQEDLQFTQAIVGKILHCNL